MEDSKVYFSYDPETHTTTCKRSGKYQTYSGKARCHPHDWDCESEFVGQHYAYVRSMIQEMVYNREEYKAQLKILRHIYNILEQNPEVSYDSIECYTIRRQIKILERDLADTKRLIRETKNELFDFIKMMDEKYKAIRERRK